MSVRVAALMAAFVTILTILATRASAQSWAGDVRSWAYQLDAVDPRALASSDFDLLVVDYSRDGSPEQALTPDEVRSMQSRSDGRRRTVLAYMSIGEAEDYRFYWRSDWLIQPPSWLDEENPDWPGNYKVRYWDPAWQSVVFGSDEAYLDRILAAGFDGVYLDIIDAFEHYEEARPTAADEMVAFVASLARYARSRRPGFRIVPQNGERLLERPEYLRVVDGIAKEDLYWGYDGQDAPTPAVERAYSERFLALARGAGKLVLTVDYPPEGGTVGEIYREARDAGYVPYATTRALDRLVVNEGLDPRGWGGSGRERRPDGSDVRVLPGGFFALTAPPGVFRVNLSADYWSERFRYGPEDFGNQGSGTFVADEFYERTYMATVSYGVTDHIEVGVALPLSTGHFVRAAADPADVTPGRRHDSGVGNVRGLVAASDSWAEDSRHVLAVLELALPTDGRQAPFASGRGEARLAVTAERYWDRVGLIGHVGASAYLGEDLGDTEVVMEAGGGVGVEFSSRLYASAMVLAEGSAVRPELSTEILLGERSSVEFFAATDVSGWAEATAVGVALNFWLGGRRSREGVKERPAPTHE